jgi:hypothetical protein
MHVWSKPGPFVRCIGCREHAPSGGLVECEPLPVLGCRLQGLLCWTCASVIEVEMDRQAASAE